MSIKKGEFEVPQPEQPGLEHIRDDFPEVVIPPNHGPEDAPEYYPVHPLQAEEHNKTPYYDGTQQPRYDGHQLRKLFRGVRRTLWIWVIGGIVLLVIIIIAAVLGAIFGGGSHDSNQAKQSSSTAMAGLPSITDAIQDSGLSVMVPIGQSGSPSVIAYYQRSSDGAIVEVQFANDTDQNPHTNIAVSGSSTRPAMKGSPIAGTSWVNSTDGDNVYRGLFYLDSQNNVIVTYVTGSGTAVQWSVPQQVQPTGQEAAAGSVALAACANATNGDDGLNGIRVYYGSNSGNVQELGWDFNASTTWNWTSKGSIDDSDAISGIGCTLHGPTALVYAHRNDSNIISQWQANSDSAWGLQQNFSSNNFKVSDIGVATDGVNNDFVFYQDSNGTIWRANIAGATTSDPYPINVTVPAGSKLGATYLMPQQAQHEAMLMFPSPNGNDSVLFAQHE